MTPEQRKRVAEIINGYEHKYDGNDLIGKYNRFLWAPRFDADAWQRSQALAVVKYLFSLSYSAVLAHLPTIRTAIQDGDIESLLSLVLELSDE